jgi:hypothetical protein
MGFLWDGLYLDFVALFLRDQARWRAGSATAISASRSAAWCREKAVCSGGNLAVVRKQTQVLIFLLLFVKHRQRLAPGRLLLIVDLAEIENGSLHRFVRSDSMVFYDAEVAMIFAVFFAMDAAQEHVHCRLPEVWCRREETWSSLYRFFRARRWKRTA